MSDTPNLALPLLSEGQGSAHVTHNEALNRLDGLVLLSIEDRDLTTPPGGESNGDCYLVKATGTGAWAGHDGEIAIYYDGWLFATVEEGWRLWIRDENLFVIYNGSTWGEVGTSGIVEGITIDFDGGGSPLVVGTKRRFEIPFDGEFNRVTMVADVSGSVVLDIWKDTYSNAPATDEDSITASAPPTISSAIKSQDSTLTDWTKTFSAGDCFIVNVDSCTTITYVSMSLKATRT